MYLFAEFVRNASFLGHALDILMNSKSSEFDLISMICGRVTGRICNRGKTRGGSYLVMAGLVPIGTSIKVSASFLLPRPALAG
jgi:hypothetical protein